MFELFSNVVEFLVFEIFFFIKCMMEDIFGYVWVCGELGWILWLGFGYIYLDLKDDCVVLFGVIWCGVVLKLKI